MWLCIQTSEMAASTERSMGQYTALGTPHFHCTYKKKMSPPILTDNRIYRISNADRPHSLSHLQCWYSTKYIAPPMPIKRTVYHTSYADTAHSISHLQCWYSTQHIAHPMLTERSISFSSAGRERNKPHIQCTQRTLHVASPKLREQGTQIHTNAQTAWEVAFKIIQEKTTWYACLPLTAINHGLCLRYITLKDVVFKKDSTDGVRTHTKNKTWI